MLIQVIICDSCDSPDYGLGMQPYSVAGGPLLHICASCEKKPYKEVQPSAKGKLIAEMIRGALPGVQV